MAIFLSAGHHNADPGAPAVDGNTEAKMAMELRDMIVPLIRQRGNKVIIDDDRETLGQYLARIQPGSGSVVCEIHFNAGPPAATGVEVLIPAPQTEQERKLAAWEKVYAADVCHKLSTIMGIKDRGVKDESQSHRGRLGLMREDGINMLLEVCFISNKSDLDKYKARRREIAQAIAEILIEADAKFA